MCTVKQLEETEWVKTNTANFAAFDSGTAKNRPVKPCPTKD